MGFTDFSLMNIIMVVSTNLPLNKLSKNLDEIGAVLDFSLKFFYLIIGVEDSIDVCFLKFFAFGCTNVYSDFLG